MIKLDMQEENGSAEEKRTVPHSALGVSLVPEEVVCHQSVQRKRLSHSHTLTQKQLRQRLQV